MRENPYANAGKNPDEYVSSWTYKFQDKTKLILFWFNHRYVVCFHSNSVLWMNFPWISLWSSSLFPVLFCRVSYAGDNFVRYTGDTISMAQTQRECLLCVGGRCVWSWARRKPAGAGPHGAVSNRSSVCLGSLWQRLGSASAGGSNKAGAALQVLQSQKGRLQRAAEGKHPGKGQLVEKPRGDVPQGEVTGSIDIGSHWKYTVKRNPF